MEPPQTADYDAPLREAIEALAARYEAENERLAPPNGVTWYAVAAKDIRKVLRVIPPVEG